MPELPEVEITRRGLEPHLTGRSIRAAVIRHQGLRWGVAADLPQRVAGLTIESVRRRGKYLILDCGAGALIIHLGMSGSFRVLTYLPSPGPHDHFDLVLDNDFVIRLRDPRRFGCVLWFDGDPLQHPLLAHLGPEPLSPDFNGAALYRETRNRSAAIKQVLMDSHVVAGVGNIYANEALFRAAIRPQTAARRVGLQRCSRLVLSVQETLKLALQAGGSSLRDFFDSNGNTGYFQNQRLVYDREGEPCFRCGAEIRLLRQGARSSYYCARCQT
jgi:formamidopyrimidine-DNA glycosylase